MSEGTVLTEESKVEQNPVDKSDMRKKADGKKWGIVGAIAIVLIALIVGIGVYNSPANSLARQLDLGNRYLEEKNYEQAAVAFEKVIEIDERCIEAYAGGVEAYIAMSDTEKLHALYENAVIVIENLEEAGLESNINSVIAIYLAAEQVYPGNFEKIIDFMRKGYDITGKNADIGERLIQNYLFLAELYIDTGNGGRSAQATADMIEAYEKAIEVLTDGFKITGDQRLKEELDKIQGMYQKALAWQDYVSSVESMLGQIANYCKDENYNQVFELMQSKEYEKVLERVEELEQVHKSSTEYGEIGIYQVDSESFGNYMIYYGEYVDGKRHGQGVWLGYYESNNYIARGTWQADMPQGDFEVREWLGKLADDVTYRVISGNVTGGVWDGNVEWTFETTGRPIDIFPVTFNMGHWVIIRQEDDIFRVSENGMAIYQKDLDEVVGIVGFATSY